jgi:hypothetical protein
MSVTFDPAGKSASIALSNGNLTATLSGVASVQQVYSNEFVVSDAVIGDQYYFEISLDSLPAGVSLEIGVDGDGYGGSGAKATLLSDGRVTDNSNYTWLDAPSTWQYATGISVVNVAVNTTTRRVWFGLDGYWRGDPAAGTGYSTYAANGAAESAVYVHVELTATSGVPVVTGRFSLQDQTYNPPTGFRAFDYLSSGYPSITGQTLVSGVPVASKPVYLYALESGGAFVDSTTSDGSGNYSFTTLYQNTSYLVVAHDPTETYEPVALSALTGSAGATVADLDFLDCRAGGPATTTYELILSSPYTEPAGHLLVLRSAPDAGEITVAIDGTERRDSSEITATFALGSITATIDATENPDAGSDFGVVVSGIADRTATIDATENADVGEIEATFTLQWVATAEITERPDTGSIRADFFPFVFASTGYNGFMVGHEGGDFFEDFTGRVVYDISATLDIQERGDVVEIFGGIQTVDMADTLYVSDEISGGKVAGLIDMLHVSDQVGKASQARSSEILYLSDTITVASFVSRDLGDALVMRDALSAHRLAQSADTLRLTDAISSGQAPALLGDTLVLSDAITGIKANTALALADTLVVQDSIGFTWVEAVSDTLHLHDTITGLNTAVAALPGDTLHLSDALDRVIAVYAPVLSDTLHLSDALSATLQAVGFLSDTLVLGDTLIREAQTLHIVNADTGAVSTYTFTPTITGMAEYRGVLYLAGPEGLYALDATDDDGDGIVWTLRTGFSNLGTDVLKRIGDVNVLARTQGDMTMQVVHNRTGEKVERSYRLPPLTRESHRDGVIHPGKGPVSVYWQFALQGIGPAEIHQMRLAVEPLSRRR